MLFKCVGEHVEWVDWGRCNCGRGKRKAFDGVRSVDESKSAYKLQLDPEEMQTYSSLRELQDAVCLQSCPADRDILGFVDIMRARFIV